jgi:hypothetical protein
MVMIPDIGVIEPSMLQAILRSAGMTARELDLHLAHVPNRSGFFAKHQSKPADAAATKKDETSSSPSKTRRG